MGFGIVGRRFLAAPFIAGAVDWSAPRANRRIERRATVGLLKLARIMFSRDLLARSWRSWFSHSAPRVGPAWLQFVWTLVWCALIAVGFTILGFVLFSGGDGAWRNWRGWGVWYGKNFVIAACIGISIRSLFALGWRYFGVARVKSFNTFKRLVFFGGVPLLGTAIGWPIGMTLGGYDLAEMFVQLDANSMVGSALLTILISFMFYMFFSMKNQQIEAERRATEARLKLLQGQIEPHFLFNTLANVTGLMDHDVARAKLMLESFVDYLRSSLSGLRVAGYTLADELTLVESYLRIIQIRMDDRLAYRIDVPDELRALPVPALTLQPLVENAIRHGLEPKIEGGLVVISARLDHGKLVLTVSDDGLGLPAPSALPSTDRIGTRTALANIRERLAEACGSAASLVIDNRQPHGVQATLTLPQGA